MARSGFSRAEENRAIRRQALREQLQNQGHIQHVVEIAEELRNLNREYSALEIQRLSKVIDTKLKLINKYLPDDKEAQDLNLSGGIEIKAMQVEFVEAEDTDSESV